MFGFNEVWLPVITRISAARGVEKLISAALGGISTAATVRRLFEYFHNMIKIHCNRCNAALSQRWEFIFINSDVFQLKVSISPRSFFQFSL